MGLLSERDVVDAGVVTSNLSSSNPVAAVSVGGAPRFVAKTGRPDAERWEQGDPAAERVLLGRLARERPSWLPEVVVCDSDVLVMGFVGEGQSLHGQMEEGREPRRMATHALGAVLRQVADWSTADIAPARVPWIFRLAERPWPRFVVEHPPAVDLASTVLTPVVARRLGSTAESWRSTRLMHGDVRWANCLVDGGGGIALVDWEYSGLGDPAWDLGCALAEHLAWGPLGPETGPDPLGDPDGLAVRAVEAVASEWAWILEAYARDASSAVADTLDATRSHVGARLLQIALQWTYWTPDDAVRARFVAAVACALLASPPALPVGSAP
ncbi:phosphotransferase family protein [Nocardioides sediminis]|uniref:phosphotransferase family protein n=1 Tax=Nocardioides sediminis TaxID=433648 RepID=UPI000D316787|nr:phosphotransferase [Nocardioides sediminis]